MWKPRQPDDASRDKSVKALKAETEQLVRIALGNAQFTDSAQLYFTENLPFDLDSSGYILFIDLIFIIAVVAHDEKPESFEWHVARNLQMQTNPLAVPLTFMQYMILLQKFPKREHLILFSAVISADISLPLLDTLIAKWLGILPFLNPNSDLERQKRIDLLDQQIRKHFADLTKHTKGRGERVNDILGASDEYNFE